jgi:hypothetical protein
MAHISRPGWWMREWSIGEVRTAREIRKYTKKYEPQFHFVRKESNMNCLRMNICE